MRAAEDFYHEKITKILTEKKALLDIGGGLRVDASRGNRFSAGNAWMVPLLKNVTYKVLDPVPDYHPDIIGDIHHLPLPDNSQEAIACLSVLEHVENPLRATEELYRVLKPGGYCFVYVPFLYYYHAEKNYYKDYWRFTKDTIELLFKKFSHIEMQPVRGATETWIHSGPLSKWNVLLKLAAAADVIFKKQKSNQVSGYHVFLVK